MQLFFKCAVRFQLLKFHLILLLWLWKALTLVNEIFCIFIFLVQSSSAFGINVTVDLDHEIGRFALCLYSLAYFKRIRIIDSLKFFSSSCIWFSIKPSGPATFQDLIAYFSVSLLVIFPFILYWGQLWLSLIFFNYQFLWRFSNLSSHNWTK